MSFRCNGPIRGDCRIEHPTLAEAVAHVEADHALQQLPGGIGFTDREPFDSTSGDLYELFTNGGTKDPVGQKKKPFQSLAKVDEIVDVQTFSDAGTWTKPKGKVLVSIYSGATNNSILQITKLAATLGPSEPITKPAPGQFKFNGTIYSAQSITIITI